MTAEFHPQPPQTRIGVLVVNLGTPDAPTYWPVFRYLSQFLLDPRVIDIHPVARNLLVRGIIAPFRSGKSARAYQSLWTEEGSPLKVYGERLVAALSELLGTEYKVVLGMRYQNPSIESALDQLMQARVGRLIVFPLFPQYASATTGSVHEEVMRVLSGRQNIPELDLINNYCTHAPMVQLYARNARAFDIPSYDHILFSYHGLPQRQLRKADECGHCLQSEHCCDILSDRNQFCYSAQCHATTRAIARELGLARHQYTICFQSRLGTDPWTQPYTIRVIEELARSGAKRLLVLCPAFTADCLETTIEIGAEYKEEFEGWGGDHIDLVPSLNDEPVWVKIIADMLKQRVPALEGQTLSL
jgi:ferrochelatase